MNNKLVLIIEESIAVSRDAVLEYVDKWGSREHFVEMEEWAFGNKYVSNSLFGDGYIIHLDLSEKDNMRKFIKLLDDKKTKDKFTGNWYGEGMIITVSTAQGISKIEKLVTAAKGTVVKKLTPEQAIAKLLKDMYFSQEIKEAIKSHVGDDYEMVTSLRNEMKKVQKDVQEGMSLEEVFIKIPQKPGSVKPWEFINPLMEGNLRETIDSFYRTIENTHVLVLMLFVKRKIDLLYRVSTALIGANPYVKSEKIAAELGCKNGPELWHILKSAKKIPFSAAQHLAEIAIEGENSIKGGRTAFGYLCAVC